MKIRFHGFRIYPGGGLPLAEFGKVLLGASSSEKEYLFNDHNRLFLFEGDSDAEFYTGLLITAKDQRSLTSLISAVSQFTLGLIDKPFAAVICLSLAAWSILMIFVSLIFLQVNLRSWFRFLDDSSKP